MSNLANNLLAQNPQPIGNIGEGPGFGPFNQTAVTANPLTQISSVISLIIGFITIVAAFYFMFQFMIGGITWISASGDKQKLQKAQDQITFGVIGLLIVVGAYGIMAIISNVLGFDFLNLESFIGNLTLK